MRERETETERDIRGIKSYIASQKELNKTDFGPCLSGFFLLWTDIYLTVIHMLLKAHCKILLTFKELPLNYPKIYFER